MKTLYLHIGTPKTGTTAIQLMCYTNEEALAKRGYVYPHLPYEYKNVSIRRNGHFLVGSNYIDGTKKHDVEKEKKILEEGLETVFSMFESFENVILSDENLWTSFAKRDVGVLKLLRERCDASGISLKVIVYLRSQDDYVTSWWKQQIKENRESYSKKTVEETYEALKSAFHYYEGIISIAEVTGKENLDARLFDRSSFVNGTIQSDFFKAVGIDDISDFVVEKEEPNVSLLGNSFEILRVLNLSTDFTDEYRDVVRKAARFCADHADKANKAVIFSDEEAAKFMERFAEGNEKLAKEFFGREDGVLFKPQTGGVKWTPENPYMYEDVINFFNYIERYNFEKNLELKAELEKKDKKHKEKIAALEKRVHELETSFPQKVARKLGLNKLGKKKK